MKIFLALPVICMLSSFSSGHDGGDIIQVPQMKQEPSQASRLTDDGYFDGLLYYKITSNSTNEVAVVKAESSAIDVTIPSQVIIDGKTYTCTRIEDNAFKELKRLTSVTIPNSITTIGEKSFSGCRCLTSVAIPNSVTSIGGYAFQDCSGLTSVHISDLNAWCRIVFFNFASNPLSKAAHLFLSGKEINNLVIPNSVTSIGNYAFSHCSELTSVTIPNSVTSIGSCAFNECSGLTTVIIPNSVTSIGWGAFLYCRRLTSITIPYSVKNIDDYTFYNCSSLTSVTIPNSVTSIGSETFRGCRALASVTIPNSVTSIGSMAFYECENLLEVVSLIENPFKIDTETFGEKVYNNSTLYVPTGTIKKYKATYGWKHFDHITENNSQGKVSEGVTYSYDKKTHTLTISGQGPMKTGREEVPWNLFKNEIQNVIIESGVTSVGDNAFSLCSGLTSVTIPNGVTSIGVCAFDGCGLTSVTIPNSVTSIGDFAFAGCSGLNSITIPNSVTSIGDGAFEGSGLTYITIPNSVTFIDAFVFAECSNLSSIKVESGNQKYDSRDNCNAVIEKSTNALIAGCKNTIIPNSVTSIGGSAFYNCSSLTSITIPNSVTSIGGSAFCNCSSLTSITIPKSVTSIDAFAFCNCSGLTSIIIPNSVTSIGDRAFYNCSSLTDYFIWAENIPSTNDYSFSSADIKNATLHVPAASVDLYRQTDPWSGFGRIVPLTDEDPKPTSLKGIIRSDNLKGEYYDLTGRKVNNPKKGLYIKNGKKVVLK